MKAAKMVLLITFFALATKESFGYDYASAQNRAHAEFGNYLYFPLGQYLETNCGFYGYRAPSGNWHGANDYTGQYGQPIYAAHNGVVIAATNGYDNTYDQGLYIGGNYVKIKNGNLTTGYSHLSASLVKVGQVVRAGDMIGKMGNSGYSTGIHLHFSVRWQGVPVDPNHKKKSLWISNPPTPAIKSQVRVASDKAIRNSADALEEIFPIELEVNNTFENKLEVIGCNIENNETNVSPCAQIIIRFNQEVDFDQLLQSLGLEPKTVIMDGLLEYSDNNSVFKISRTMFTPNQDYRLTINNLSSNSGAKLESWQVKFRTGDWPIEPFERPDRELVIQKGLVHLGDDGYDGPINQGFRKKSSGLSWQKSFLLDEWYPLIILQYNSRGVECVECTINNNYVKLPLNTRENNGEVMEVELPGEYFKKGAENTIEIRSLISFINDYDDIEFWNMKILY
jgi:hypothetical protein